MGNCIKSVDPIIFHDLIEEHELTTDETSSNEQFSSGIYTPEMKNKVLPKSKILAKGI